MIYFGVADAIKKGLLTNYAYCRHRGTRDSEDGLSFWQSYDGKRLNDYTVVVAGSCRRRVLLRPMSKRRRPLSG